MPQVNFRTSSERSAVIDREAAIRGVSRIEFLLLSSEATAIKVLNERPIIALDAPVEIPGCEGAVRAPVPVGPLSPPEPLATTCYNRRRGCTKNKRTCRVID